MREREVGNMAGGVCATYREVSLGASKGQRRGSAAGQNGHRSSDNHPFGLVGGSGRHGVVFEASLFDRSSGLATDRTRNGEQQVSPPTEII